MPKRHFYTRPLQEKLLATIRTANPGDLAVVQRIVHAAYAPYVARIGKPPGPMLDDYASRIAAGQAWVAEHAGRIVGILVLEDSSDGFLLDNVAVDPDCQGAGIGRALIGFAEAEARRRGRREIRLYTHALMTENQALYRRSGYSQVARVQEKGFDRIYMAKPLL